MSCNVRGILLHTSELLDIEERIIYAFPFLFEKYRYAIFYKIEIANSKNNGDRINKSNKAKSLLSIGMKGIKCF